MTKILDRLPPLPRTETVAAPEAIQVKQRIKQLQTGGSTGGGVTRINR